MKFSWLEMLGGGLLITAWLLYGANFIGDTLVHVAEAPHAKSTATAKAKDGGGAPAKAEAEAPAADLATLLASADADAGKKAFNKCKSCHNVDKGAKNKVGPNLWNIAGGAKAAVPGFKYSDVLVGLGGTWSLAELDAFIANPKGMAPGTRMSYGGMKNAGDRAALILFLREQSDNPVALP